MRSRRTSAAARRLRSTTRGSTTRPRRAARPPARSRTSPTASSSSTRPASCATGTRPRRRSRGVAARDVLGRQATEALPGWAGVAGRVPVAEDPASPARPETLPLELAGGERWLSISAVGFARGHGLRLPRPDRGAGARAAAVRLRLDGLARAANAARRDLRRRADAAAARRRAARGAARRAARRDRGRVRPARAHGQRHPLGEPARQRDDAGRDRALRPARAGRDRAAGVPRPRARRQSSSRSRRRPMCPPWRPIPTRCARCSRTSSRTRSSTRPTAAGSRSRSRAAGNQVRFAVTDQGLGIPGPEQRRIFDKFYRLDPHLTRGRRRHRPRPLHLPRARPPHGRPHLGRVAARAPARPSRSSCRPPDRRGPREGRPEGRPVACCGLLSV